MNSQRSLRVQFLRAQLIVLMIFPAISFAEIPSTLTIGVPQFSARGNILRDDDIAFQLVRGAVADPLLRMRESGKSTFSLILADSFQVDADLVTWSYRIRDGLIFSNGQPLGAADICNSLLACGPSAAKHLPTIESCTVRSAQVDGGMRDWIDLKFKVERPAAERQAAVGSFLAACPTFEKRTRAIFGKDYGDGVNVLGVGEYRIIGFHAGKDYVIERYQQNPLGRTVPQQVVEIKGFAREDEALAALRDGSVLMFFSANPELLQSVAGDETLKSKECNGNKLIYRRGVDFECAGGVKISSITWTLPQ